MKAGIIPVTPFQQNCSLIWDEETMKGAFVDPGGEIERLLATADEQGVEIEKLLLTHGHLDHAAATTELAETLGVKVEGPHRDDDFLLQELPTQAASYNFPPARVCTPDRWLEDGDTVTVGNITLNVLHCPGHTPGHVVFHAKQAGLAIVGDVLFQGSIGRTDFPRGDHAQLISSIKDKLFPLGDDITFIPGHGPTSTFGHEKQWNPFVGAIAD